MIFVICINYKNTRSEVFFTNISAGDFEGATVTERFISHFKFFHDGQTCS